MILSGDQLYQMDYRKLMARHKENGSHTVATIPVNDQDATGFGIMKTNEHGLIDSFVEKPAIEEFTKWGSKVPEEYL